MNVNKFDYKKVFIKCITVQKFICLRSYLSMALCSNVSKTNYLFCRYLLMASSNKWLKCFIRRHGDKSIALHTTDCLDDFTTQLMQTKSNKWEIMRANRRILCSEREQFKVKSHAKEIKLHVEYLDVNKLDMLLRDAMEADNISYITEIFNECIKCKKLPTVAVLLQTLLFCSQYGDKNMITSIAKLCSEVQPNILKDYSDFKHYMAKAVWVKGDINRAIIMFEDVYRNHSNMRRIIRFMLKQLLLDAVTNRSEAALLNMISFAERLVKDFKDFYPLACIWQACFLSEWFTDQTLALELLEEKDGLLNVVSSQILFIVSMSLKKHQTEVVYRLLELLLRLKQISECTRVLEALFDYRVSQGDLHGCSEIIKWSIKQGIDVQVFRHESFIKLLLSCASDPTIAAYINVNSKRPSKSGYQFKF